MKKFHVKSTNQNDSIITDDLQLANLFNDCFTQFGSMLRPKDPLMLGNHNNLLMILKTVIGVSVSVNCNLINFNIN